jgi:hypothetical protein
MGLHSLALLHQYAGIYLYSATQVQASTAHQTTACSIQVSPYCLWHQSPAHPGPDTSELLDANRKCHIQEIVGALLYYASAVDKKLLVAISTISARQAKATIATEQASNLLLDYVATYPNDAIAYQSIATWYYAPMPMQVSQ